MDWSKITDRLIHLLSYILYITGIPANHTILPENDTKVCVKEQCQRASQLISNYINASANPCDDFYQFTCGNFLASDRESKFAKKLSLSHIVQDDMKNLVKEQIRNSDERKLSGSARMLKKLFDTCTNRFRVNEPLEIDNFNDLKSKIENLVNENEGPWMKMKEKFSNVKEVILDHLEFYYSNQTAGRSQRNFLASMLHHFPVEHARSNIRDVNIPDINLLLIWLRGDMFISELVFKQVFDYCVELNRIVLVYKKNGTKHNNSATHSLVELREMYQSIIPKEFVDRVAKSQYKNLQINDGVTRIIPILSFLSDLEKLIEKIPKETQVRAFALIQIMEPNEYYEQISQLSGGTIPTIVHIARVWSQMEIPDFQKFAEGICSEFIFTHVKLVHLLRFTYASKYMVNKSVLRSIRKFSTSIREETKNIIKKVSWADKVTKKASLRIISTLKESFGVPHELLNTSFFEEYSKKFNLSERDHDLNLIKILNYKLDDDKFFLDLHQKYDLSHAAVLPAYFSNNRHTINFAVPFLREPFFNQEQPRYMNYALFGYYLGHEAAHSFVNVENYNSPLKRSYFPEITTWPSDEMIETFNNRSVCLKTQYEKWTLEKYGKKFSGVSVFNESLADLIGFRSAYNAYLKSIEQYGPELMLPGLSYNPKQLFWIARALSSCSKVQTFDEVHPPNEFRATKIVSNIQEFANDFQCPENSKMDPVEKCTVW